MTHIGNNLLFLSGYNYLFYTSTFKYVWSNNLPHTRNNKLFRANVIIFAYPQMNYNCTSNWKTTYTIKGDLISSIWAFKCRILNSQNRAFWTLGYNRQVHASRKPFTLSRSCGFLHVHACMSVGSVNGLSSSSANKGKRSSTETRRIIKHGDGCRTRFIAGHVQRCKRWS